MSSEITWDMVRELRELESRMSSAAEEMRQAAQKIQYSLDAGYGGNGPRLIELLEQTSLIETAENRKKPDYWLGYGLQAYTEKPREGATPLWSHPPAVDENAAKKLLDEAIQAMCNLLTSDDIGVYEDDLTVPASDWRIFVDAHAKLLYERNLLKAGE